jgi:hypothetical protein
VERINLLRTVTATEQMLTKFLLLLYIYDMTGKGWFIQAFQKEVFLLRQEMALQNANLFFHTWLVLSDSGLFCLFSPSQTPLTLFGVLRILKGQVVCGALVFSEEKKFGEVLPWGLCEWAPLDPCGSRSVPSWRACFLKELHPHTFSCAVSSQRETGVCFSRFT